MNVGPYVLDGVVGAGGMGTVHRAHHKVLKKDVAVKELTHADPSARSLFLQEAQLLFGLKHPNFPTVLDLIEAKGRTFLVMDFVQGPSLSSVIQQRRLQPAEVTLLGQGLCHALEFLHGTGVLHRDVKPDNILLPHGLSDPVLVDLGIASRMGVGGPQAFTPGMAAPEQVLGGVCSVASDLYQVGATLFIGVMGQPPKDVCTRTHDDDLGVCQTTFENLAEHTTGAIRWSLKLDASQRPQKARVLHQALSRPPGQHGYVSAPSPRRGMDIRR